MANVLINKNGKLEYLTSVDTGDYVVNPNVPKDKIVPKNGVLINPDLTLVRNVDMKYWKITGNQVIPMNLAERQVIDDAEAVERQQAKDNFIDVSTPKLIKALILKGVITKEDLNG